MSNKRPPLRPMHTRGTEENRNAALDQGARIILDGVAYEVRAGDLNGLTAAKLRKECGYSFNRLLELLSEDADLDVLGALVWLSRIVKGEAVSLNEVLEGIGYQQIIDEGFDVELIQEPEEVDPTDPEA